jgi:hypothetical protein
VRKLLPFCLLVAISLGSCANLGSEDRQAEVDADFAGVVRAIETGDSDAALAAMAAFDAKYGTALYADLAPASERGSLSGGSSYPELADLPFAVDGAVYLSGGGDDLISKTIGWVAPKSLPGGFYHGGALDLDKYDPNNLDAPCVQTAVVKGAGYESARDWRKKPNVAVMAPAFAVSASRLNQAQSALDYYCRPANTDMKYGFFKSYVNIFNVVTKDDNYWWYCTKVAWRMWSAYGIDIDSNSAAVDFRNSGLYGLVKAYYSAIYFWSPSRANKAIEAYIQDARAKIVMAEEIMLSPYFRKVYEAIRQN